MPSWPVQKLTDQNLRLALPFLEKAPPDFLTDLKNHSSPMSFEKGQQLMHEHDKCQYLPIVLSGSIRVYRVNAQAKELTLYYIEPGESCFLSANCIFMKTDFPAAARAEEYTEALMVQATAMARWLDQYSFWQKYVFEIAAKRLITVISAISDMTFTSIEVRLAKALLQHLEKNGDNELHITHQHIASELGTAREVITRSLKNFERQNLLTLARSRINVDSKPGLEKIAMAAEN